MADIAVAPGHIVHRAPDLLTLRHRNGDFAVDVVLDLADRLLIHLLSAAVKQLDAVIVVGVVGSRDHDAAVKVIHPGDVGHAGRRGDMHDIVSAPLAMSPVHRAYSNI